jgi:hypothetical protein
MRHPFNDKDFRQIQKEKAALRGAASQSNDDCYLAR